MPSLTRKCIKNTSFGAHLRQKERRLTTAGTRITNFKTHLSEQE